MNVTYEEKRMWKGAGVVHFNVPQQDSSGETKGNNENPRGGGSQPPGRQPNPGHSERKAGASYTQGTAFDEGAEDSATVWAGLCWHLSSHFGSETSCPD
jgi:hypothetical protein